MTIAELMDKLEMIGLEVNLKKEDDENMDMDISNIYDIDIWTKKCIGG